MRSRQWLVRGALVFLLLGLAGCGHHEVRHLASDAALVVPGRTPRQEVISLLGFPDDKEQRDDGQEVWYYFERQQSRLRRTPYVGKWLGSEEYDVLVITLRGDEVVSCVYRNLTPAEFERLGLAAATTIEE